MIFGIEKNKIDESQSNGRASNIDPVVKIIVLALLAIIVCGNFAAAVVHQKYPFFLGRQIDALRLLLLTPEK